MCKCTPSIRTPFCGKGDCVPPVIGNPDFEHKLEVFVKWEDPECDLIATVFQIQDILKQILNKEIQ